MSSLAVEAIGVVKRFGQHTVLHGIDLEVQSGTCVGVLGPNGAGKTTTLEILEGLQAPTAGSVQIFGKSWETAREELLGRIGVQLQETRFFERLTVAEVIRLFRSFYPKSPLSAAELISSMALEKFARSETSKLSGGARQRLALATALASDPELLFLDEPTAGLDPHARALLWDIIRRLKGEGRTVIMTTHYMDEATNLCDELALIDAGRVVAKGTPAGLTASLGVAEIVEFACDRPLGAELLARLPGVLSQRVTPNGGVLGVSSAEVVLGSLLALAREQGVVLRSTAARRPTLDDVFLQVTGRTLADAEATRE